MPNSLPFGAEGSAGLPNQPKLPFSESENQSNTNSGSTKSTVFRIGTNQIHPTMERAYSAENQSGGYSSAVSFMQVLLYLNIIKISLKWKKGIHLLRQEVRLYQDYA